MLRVMRLRRNARSVTSEIERIIRAVRAAGATRVYIAYRWYEEDTDGVAALVNHLQQADFAEAVLVRDIPAYNLGLVGCWVQQNAMLVSGLCNHDLREPLPGSLIQNADKGEWLQVSVSNLPVIDTHAALCENGICPVLHGDVLIYQDGTHLHGNLPCEAQLWLYERLFASDRDKAEVSGP
ncbi:SGNH hydrolase domain-containing protein [Aurantiacibacter odishensis]|uniref:SGNH hydrolase domain-containing protein n=1 Tax=Aurantiacibacter odishensis TaxID=1155476 RepID=UPI000E727B5C|nr:SGNH hydrolase domain-containing protein [Aurantiacibacter odishensis]